jgi:hypothetical protein
MVDFIDEVNEDLRQERFTRFWQKVGVYVVAASVLIVVATVASVLWQNYRDKRQSQAAEVFLSADKAAKAQKYDEAAKTYAEVATLDAQGFSELAKMREAYVLTKANKKDSALTVYKDVAETRGGDKAVRSLARSYAAMLMMETNAPAEEITDTLQPLAKDTANPFSAFAREHMAYIALEKGDSAEAHRMLTELSNDAEAPASLRRRTQAQLATVAEMMDAGAAEANVQQQPE